MSRSLLGIGSVLCAAVALGGEPAPPPRSIPVEELVEQLGIGPVAQREAAEKRLSAMAVDPPPEVLAALKSLNLDRRDRAARIVQAMRWSKAATRLPRGQRFAEQGQVDLFVAATAVWDLRPDDDRLWEPAVDFGRRLIEKADMKGDRKPHNCPSSYKDFATYLERCKLRFKRFDELYTRGDPRDADPPVLNFKEAIQAPGMVSSTGITSNLIVSRGSVQTEKGIHQSVVFANGDVTAPGGLYSSVLVCDGDVTVANRDVTQVLVVARGNITVKGFAARAVLVAGGKVTIGEPQKVPPEDFNVFRENESNPLGYVTFFELHRVGLEVKAADGAVTVAKVAAGSACEKAGLKVGDVILEAGGKKPADAEALRRLLRDALAVGDANLKLKRSDKIETVKVVLPE